MHVCILIRKPKRVKWALFYSERESTTEASRLRKILAKTDNAIGYIHKPLGNCSISSEETLGRLFDVHFPGCSATAPSVTPCTSIDDAIIEIIIDDNKIKWAVFSLKPFKSAGPDGIAPAQLQNSYERILP